MARRDTADQAPADPGLPFKRRARRRLVGALVIGLAAAVMLPLVLDREPRYPRPDIRVDIPGRDAPLPVRVPTEAEPPAVQRAPAGPAEARAARADAGRAAEARAAAGSPTANSAQTAADARLTSREPMVQQSDLPPDGSPRAAGAARGDAEAARAAAAKADAARQEAARAADAARASAARQEVARQEAARRESARQEVARSSQTPQAPPTRADSPRPADSVSEARGYPSQNWAVQIGQFARPDNARNAEARASGLGLRAYSETLQTAQGERVRVRAGPFATRSAAEEARGRLLAAGLEAALIAPEGGR